MKRKSIILIVDDIPDNVHVLFNTLKKDFVILVATNGEKALELASKEPMPDLILLDVMMPGMDGYEVCRRLKADELSRNIPVIFVTALSESINEAKGLGLGAVDYITKPINLELLKSRVANHLELKRHRDDLQALVDERTSELKLANEAMIEAMGIVAEGRDPETGNHIQRTKKYMGLLLEKLSHNPKYTQILTAEMIDRCYQSAPLHDIGKVGIPDNILLKPGKLTAEEFKIMKMHTTIGAKTIGIAQGRIGKKNILETAKEIAGSHHEKWNGSGYPNGLKGEAIPLSGRLMAVADVYDALVSRRVYKEPFSHSSVVQMIQDQSGKHFDPDVVDVFLQLQEEFREVAIKFADNEDETELLRR